MSSSISATYRKAKPSTSFAPIALTPDGPGEHWRDGRVQLELEVIWNEQRFGHPHGGEMQFSFGELLAHAARTRRLGAGTVVGTGTVSNAGGARGSACIAERRVIEIIAQGAPSTPFMRLGDRIRMCARTPGGDSPFGAIDQRVVCAAVLHG